MADQSCCKLWWDESNGVVRSDYLPGVVCGLDDARAIYAEVDELGRRESPICVDLRAAPTIHRSARQYFMNESRFSAVAMLVDSAVTRMLANFFLRLDTSSGETRMFTDEADALAWLREHR